jgi:hypothetical protein
MMPLEVCFRFSVYHRFYGDHYTQVRKKFYLHLLMVC